MKTEKEIELKLKEGKARRILRDDKLSEKEISWEVPYDLIENINQKNHFQTFISLGRWRNTNEKFILISKEGVLIYLEKEVVKKLWESLK